MGFDCEHSMLLFYSFSFKKQPNNITQKKVQRIKEGKDKLFGWFVGEVMKKTKGQADPKLVNDLLKTHMKLENLISVAHEKKSVAKEKK